MPLVRFQVRNQYGLGQPELYSEADGEDPKAVLDGVAVAGLVGILRQLGDLAEFAGEVFHGLQEQVTTTASRSHKLMVRVQNIEAALPPIEKAIQAQTSHLHFAYTPGVEWHPRIGNEQNHFIYNDLPRFIMDSYEECRDPPRLHLLDRFDTSGSGSCMKRYSDPTFFRRVSTSSNDKNIEKARKDKKIRKIKKKRSSSLRNGEFSRGTSIYSCSGRMQFASSIGNGQASPSQTASTVDKTLKSEPERSYSFDSRTGSGYIECVFPREPSMQSEEHDSKKDSPRSLQHDDNIDSVFSDSIEEKIVPGSSCVSWEEKEEIVEPKGQHYDDYEEDQAILEKSEIDMVKNVDRMDTVFDDENAPASTSDGSELDDIESETDNYVDALNTIESESECDHDYQTKQEVKQDLNVNHKEMKDEINELHASDTESYNVSNKEVPADLPVPASSEGIVHENRPEVVEISLNSDHSATIDTHRSADTHAEAKVDSIICNASPSGSSDLDLQDQSGKRVITSFFAGSQESPTIRNASSPSGSSDHQDQSGKGVVTSFFPGSQDSPTISNASSPSGSGDHHDRSGKRVITGFASSQESPTISNASSPSGSSDHDLQDQSGKRVITSFPDSQESPAEISSTKPVKLWTNGGLLGLQPSKPPDFAVSNTKTEVFLSTIKDGEDKRKDCTPTANPSGKDKESDDLLNGKRSCHANLENDEKSSLMFGLGHRLLVNGFHRKLALGPDDDVKPVLSNSLERIQETTFRDSPSSPPLEHMKISFHPVNGCETSKMKLNLESVEDMFPSFQLVPDSVMPSHDTDFDSDSDDGTFCRSSPYISDDCNSVQSDLNSEEWEADENIGSKDMELYDAFCRVEGSESVSSSDANHLSNENGVEHTRSCPSPEPPRLDVVNSVHQQEPRGDSDPLPPPLPPVQWRVLKSQPEMKQEPHDRKEALELMKPSISQQARSDPAVQLESNGAVGFELKNEEWSKMNRQSKAKEASNGKGVVEREDFLQQIRTQSFNLRRITPAKPAPVTAPTSNVSVTAILEKANAIRQAVASDDGEEDTWSDT